MNQILPNLNAVVSVLCLLMALHLLCQRAFYQLPVRLLATCFLALGLQSFFLGINLSSGLNMFTAALQPAMAVLFGPLSYFTFQSVFNEEFRFKPTYLLHLTPATLVFVFMLNQQSKFYVDYLVLLSLLGYALLLTKMLWANKHYLHLMPKNANEVHNRIEKILYIWLLIFTVYSWLNWVSDFLIFFEITTRKSSIQSTALLTTVIFKLLVTSFTVFFTLQKSPFFDWLYITFNTKEPKSKINQGFDNIISSFEFLLREPHVYTKEVLSLKAMANRLNVPARALSNAVNHHYGESYTKHMNRLRIKFAENLLLKQPKLSITAVMYECGFHTKSNFNKEFKAVNGLSPSGYRQSQSNAS